LLAVALQPFRGWGRLRGFACVGLCHKKILRKLRHGSF